MTEGGAMGKLPELCIIGAIRGGTTSLFHYLRAHKKIAGSITKETHFFDKHYDRGIDWYASRFPAVTKGTMTLEATPHYLHHPAVPGRMKEHLPEAKLIVLLRNPVDRLWSHFCHLPRPYSLSDIDLLNPELPLVKIGRYAEHLERWFYHFDRKQFLIIRSEDFFENPRLWTNRTLRWLGFGYVTIDLYRRFDPLARYKTHGEMPTELRKEVAAYYRPHNQRLYELLGYDFGWK